MKFTRVIGPPNTLNIKDETPERLEKLTEDMPSLANGEHSRADLHEHLQSYGQWHLNRGGRQ